jgi:hypothetical protein
MRAVGNEMKGVFISCRCAFLTANIRRNEGLLKIAPDVFMCRFCTGSTNLQTSSLVSLVMCITNVAKLLAIGEKLEATFHIRIDNMDTLPI